MVVVRFMPSITTERTADDKHLWLRHPGPDAKCPRNENFGVPDAEFGSKCPRSPDQFRAMRLRRRGHYGKDRAPFGALRPIPLRRPKSWVKPAFQIWRSLP
jgi:hypothetical protein